MPILYHAFAFSPIQEQIEAFKQLGEELQLSPDIASLVLPYSSLEHAKPLQGYYRLGAYMLNSAENIFCSSAAIPLMRRLEANFTTVGNPVMQKLYPGLDEMAQITRALRGGMEVVWYPQNGAKWKEAVASISLEHAMQLRIVNGGDPALFASAWYGQLEIAEAIWGAQAAQQLQPCFELDSLYMEFPKDLWEQFPDLTLSLSVTAMQMRYVVELTRELLALPQKSKPSIQAVALVQAMENIDLGFEEGGIAGLAEEATSGLEESAITELGERVGKEPGEQPCL